jgi:tRNA U38,U39,U40 pseudouridine synthase TruA
MTVSNVIEDSLKTLSNMCSLKSNLVVSSRTDAGVHAIVNTGHFDIELNEEFLRTSTDENGIRKMCILLKDNLNEIFISNNHFIR